MKKNPCTYVSEFREDKYSYPLARNWIHAHKRYILLYAFLSLVWKINPIWIPPTSIMIFFFGQNVNNDLNETNFHGFTVWHRANTVV